MSDEERIDQWLLGLVTGVTIAVAYDILRHWWFDTPDTWSPCEGCGKRGADTVNCDGTWHQACWFAEIERSVKEGTPPKGIG